MFRAACFRAIAVFWCAVTFLAPSLAGQSPFTRLGSYSLSRQVPNYETFAGMLLANASVGGRTLLIVSEGTGSSTRFSPFGSRASAGFAVVGDRIVLFERAANQDLKASVVNQALRLERSGTLAAARIIGPVVDDAIYMATPPNGSRTSLYRYVPSDGSYRFLFDRTPRGGGGWTRSVGRASRYGLFMLVMNETVNSIPR